jgi:phospholipid/cholesterol/gamma-HCH transport system permease protein
VFAIEEAEVAPEGAAVRIRGSVALPEAAALWARVQPIASRVSSPGTLHFDMSQVEAIDGTAVALLSHLRAELQQRGVRSEFMGASQRVQDVIHLYRGDVRVGRPKRRKAQGTLDQIGAATMASLREVQHALAFRGDLLIASWRVVRAPRSLNWREIAPTIERVGADAVPIIMLINFLVGLVMALQSATQLRRFGADIFIADLIGISMARELGPLMTAIVVCGRSGAALAAELGTMKVSEEIDALRAMGFGPMRFLVLPRTMAMIVVMPLLTLVADIVGVLGGLVIAMLSLDLTPAAYFTQMAKSVKLWDFYSGVIKSALFGLTIALIACQQGLATTGGAEGVGRRTTSAVVTTLFMLIVVDAIFTAFFRATRL